MVERKLKNPLEVLAAVGGLDGIAKAAEKHWQISSDEFRRELDDFAEKFGVEGVRNAEQEQAFAEFLRLNHATVREIHTEEEKYDWLAELYVKTGGRVAAETAFGLDVDWNRVRSIVENKSYV